MEKYHINKVQREINKCAGIGQSQYWADFCIKCYNAEVERIEVINSFNNNVVAMTQLIYLPAKRNSNLVDKIKMYLLGQYNGKLEIINGPQYYEEIDKEIITKCIFDYILNECKNRRIKVIKFLNTSFDEKIISSEELKNTFSNFERIKWATYKINLQNSYDELNKRVKHSVRQNIKKCIKQELTIKEISSLDEYINVFWKNYSHFEMLQGRKVHDTEIEKIAYNLNINGNAKWYVALQNDIVIATLGMYIVDGMATEIASSINPICYEKKIPAQDFIHWNLILSAKELDCKYFDLAGVNPEPINDKEKGIRRFKEKWGGEYEEYYNFIITPFYTKLLKKVFLMLKK